MVVLVLTKYGNNSRAKPAPWKPATGLREGWHRSEAGSEQPSASNFIFIASASAQSCCRTARQSVASYQWALVYSTAQAHKHSPVAATSAVSIWLPSSEDHHHLLLSLFLFLPSFHLITAHCARLVKNFLCFVSFFPVPFVQFVCSLLTRLASPQLDASSYSPLFVWMCLLWLVLPLQLFFFFLLL